MIRLLRKLAQYRAGRRAILLATIPFLPAIIVFTVFREAIEDGLLSDIADLPADFLELWNE